MPTDDEGSVDSRGRALAYFQNPLYRHVDGRPGIVRRNSKRPALSPRQTMMGKGKEAAQSFGRIARNVGSPHLWDGRKASRSRDRDSRRRSHPDNHHHYSDDPPPPTSGAYDNRYSPREHSGHSHHRRRGSQLEPPSERPTVAAADDEDWDGGDEDPVYSTQPRRSTPSDGSKHRPSSRHDYRDQQLRHSKSHEPTPTQREGEDYFQGYDDPQQRRNSSHEKPYSPPSANGIGPSFGPSASPLFASHLAKQPQPPPPRSQPGPPPPADAYQGGAPLRNLSIRRAQGRYPSRSPEPGSRPPPPMDPRDPRDRKYDSPVPSRPPPGRGYNQSPMPYDDMGPGPGGPPPHPGPPMGSRYAEPGAPPPRDYRDRDPRDRDPRDRDPRDRDSRDRRSNRMSAPDLDSYYSGEDGRRSRPKQTRFADAGVSGRRYPDESPWDERRRS